MIALFGSIMTHHSGFWSQLQRNPSAAFQVLPHHHLAWCMVISLPIGLYMCILGAYRGAQESSGSNQRYKYALHEIRFCSSLMELGWTAHLPLYRNLSPEAWALDGITHRLLISMNTGEWDVPERAKHPMLCFNNNIDNDGPDMTYVCIWYVSVAVNYFPLLQR